MPNPDPSELSSAITSDDFLLVALAGLISPVAGAGEPLVRPPLPFWAFSMVTWNILLLGFAPLLPNLKKGKKWCIALKKGVGQIPDIRVISYTYPGWLPRF